ncbi:MAG: alpha/beta fold hydrolase, partial [Sphingobium sp.]
MADAPSARFTRTEFAMQDGVRIIGDVGGDPSRPTVALMHGGGQTRHSWSGAMRALVQAGYHVINFDARGHGESDWSPDGVYTLSVRARDLGEILRDLRGPVAFVGASMGGATALYAVGEQVPPAPAALVMVDIVPRPNPVGTGKIKAFMGANPEGFATLEEAADAVAAYNPHRP